MANLWVHNGTDWVQGVPSVARPTGYVPGAAVYARPTTSTWSVAWQRDTTPPPAPLIETSIVSGTRNKLRITITTPVTSKKFLRCVVKVGINKWATSPTANDGMFYTESNAGEQWSEWFTASLVADNTIEPEEVATKDFPATYQANINLPLNTAINISAWVQDTSLNWSAAATKTQYTRKSTDTPAGMSVFKTAIMPTSWDAWSEQAEGWLYRSKGKPFTHHDYVLNPAFGRWQVFTGTFGKWRTYVCYGNRVRQVLNTAYEVRKVSMPLRRRSYQSGVTPQEAASVDGPINGTILRVYPLISSNVPSTPASGQIIAGTYSDIQTQEWSYGGREDIVFPEKFWQQFINGKGNANSVAFYTTARTASTSNNDKYSASFALTNGPGVSGYASKINKYSDGLDSGVLVVEWVGYSNPWPTATPGVAGFKPMGWTGTW
jgi:hypothetical protein